MMKYRAMQMTLVIHYAQELRRIVIETVKSSDSLKHMHDAGFAERVPQGTKNPFGKAIKAWLADGLIEEDEADELKRLTDFRNDIAHRMHLLAADLSQHRFVRDIVRSDEGKLPTHDFHAADRMKALIRLLHERISEHRRIFVASPNSLIFETAQKALEQELAALRRKLDKLYNERKSEIVAMQSEIEAMRKDFSEADFPGHPLDTYDNGRLTPRGQEQVYRLFDRGYSPLAIAYVMRLSLRAVRKREAMWKAAGGRDRHPIDINKLPWRKFYATADD